MKRKQIEKIEPVAPKEKGYRVTIQELDNILILNLYKDKKMYARHCVNHETGEYGTYANGTWTEQKIESAMGIEAIHYYCYWDSVVYNKADERFVLSKEDKLLLKNHFSYWNPPKQNSDYAKAISSKESGYKEQIRERAEERRIERVFEKMDCIPAMPEGILDWINEKLFGGYDYLTKDKERRTYTCSACGKNVSAKKAEGLGRHNDTVECPICKAKVMLIKRSNRKELTEHFTIIQPVNDRFSVERHFQARKVCGDGKKKRFYLKEEIRILLLKGRKGIDIYYHQQHYEEPVQEAAWVMGGFFDNKGNRANQRFYECFLYDGGINEALKNGQKSLIMLSGYIDLTEEEKMCILFHMGSFSDSKEWEYYSKAIKKYPNVLYTHMADMIASQIDGV